MQSGRRGMKMNGNKREKRNKQRASKDEGQKLSIPTQRKMPHWGKEINLHWKRPQNKWVPKTLFYPFPKRFILNPIPGHPPPSCLPFTSIIKQAQARAEYSTINTLPGCFPRPAPPHTNPAARYPSTHCQATIYLLHKQQQLPAPLATQQLSWPHNNLLFSAS